MQVAGAALRREEKLGSARLPFFIFGWTLFVQPLPLSWAQH
jgi:hypothetical protein